MNKWTFANWIAYAVATLAIILGLVVAFAFQGSVVTFLIFLAAAVVAVMRQACRRGR
jgi:hypothetical protein